jgi:hypothetical protein
MSGLGRSSGGGRPTRSGLFALGVLAGGSLFFVFFELTRGVTISVSLTLCVEVAVVPLLLLIWNTERRRK